MARRTFRGNSYSENGWPYVDQGSCTWVLVPGSNDVWLQIQNGAPLQVLRAFAADFNAYVEPLRDADSACWTPDNSVSTSNHPGGTGMDLNWEGPPEAKVFRYGISEAKAYPGDKARKLRELLDWYEGTVFCGGFWDIRDWMHFQMGANTYDRAHDRTAGWVDQFIARKIRADGFSTFKRGGSGGHVELSKKDSYAMAAITVGNELGITPKGQKIAITTQLVETNRTMYANRNVPESLNFPHDAVGADHDSTGLYQQRQAWGPLSVTMDPIGSSRLFYLGGRAGQRGLTAFPYNTDARTPGGWAQAVQVSAFPDRYDERYAEATDIYNRLSLIGEDDPLADPAVIKKINEIHACLFNKTESTSDLATPGEGAIWQLHEKIHNLDGMVHPIHAERRARAGDLGELHRIVVAASGNGKKRDAVTVGVYQSILASIENDVPEVLLRYKQVRGIA
ncbi:endolysin [Mycobacterium phage HINdeR]|uniref:Lysin A n=1 Tax=Mycobacterium phage HINdeR TaxID=1327770 RepID=R4JHN4_9CAUD|nr:endolysin [Mycobacterium phage HINdeR]AGK87487.1 lysin A [Mycobacterium phage HINdeR]